MSRREYVNNEWQSRADRPPPTDRQIGPGRRAAYGLARLNLDVVARTTVRAMLPTGTTRPISEYQRRRKRAGESGAGGSTNRVSEAYQRALAKFESEGWIQRGERYLLVKNRAALLDYALEGCTDLPRQMLRLDAAIEKVRQEMNTSVVVTPAAIEQAHREIAAIKALMRSEIPSASWSGRGRAHRVGLAGSGE